MKKKFLSIILLIVALVVLNVKVQAADGLFNMGVYEEIYKLSEQGEEIKLPFFNYFLKNATYDKDIKHSGISFAGSTIDVNQKLEGIHVIFSPDMVSIKGEVENGIIYGNNIVVEGKITGDTILMAPTVQILESAEISKDVIIVTHNLTMKGKVLGNLIGTVTEKATISGEISKDLRIISKDVSFENDKVKGEVYLETEADAGDILTKYPNAIVKELITEEQVATPDIMKIVTTGIVTVVVYSAVCLLITKKENNIVTNACIKFKTYTVFGILMAFAALTLIILIPVLLIVLAVFGLGIIAWPMLITYLGIILLSISISSFVVGATLYEAIKEKVVKYKYIAIPGIFAIIYIICNIPVISMYALMAINLISLGIIITTITKKIDIKEVKNENN